MKVLRGQEACRLAMASVVRGLLLGGRPVKMSCGEGELLVRNSYHICWQGLKLSGVVRSPRQEVFLLSFLGD